MQGVQYTPEETKEIKEEILTVMVDGLKVPFYLAVKKVNRVSVTIAYEWRQNDPDFDTAVEAARKRSDESIVDLAESRMVKTINDPSLKDHGKMVRFCLERKAKHRGYASRNELTGPGGVPLNPNAPPAVQPTDEEALAAASNMVRRPPPNAG